MLTEKYRPDNMFDYVGHEDQVRQFSKWMRSWSPGKAMMFHGPPGVGKTSLVLAYASENKTDVIETNASDFRSAKQLMDDIGSAVTQASLSNRKKIILIDEVDGISGYEDKGGVGAIIDMIENTMHPIILVANNPYDKKLQSLRQHCEMLQFSKLVSGDIVKRLQRVSENEGLHVPRDILVAIARKSEGDLRSSINDLEAMADGYRIFAEYLDDTGNRERETPVFDALRTIFKSMSVQSARLSIGMVDKDPEEVFWWVENNVFAEYDDPEEVAKAYDALSKADIFRKRIMRKQDWKLLAYFIDMMTGGVAAAKKAPYRKFVRYQYPSNISYLGRTKVARKEEKEELVKLSKELHCSTRKIRFEYLPMLKSMGKWDF